MEIWLYSLKKSIYPKPVLLLIFLFWREKTIPFTLTSLAIFAAARLQNIDGCHSVDRINCSLVTPVSRQMQSDGYQ